MNLVGRGKNPLLTKFITLKFTSLTKGMSKFRKVELRRRFADFRVILPVDYDSIEIRNLGPLKKTFLVGFPDLQPITFCPA